MNGTSHRNIAKLLFPNIKYKEIDAINSAIDSPTRRSKAFNEAYTSIMGPDGRYYNPFDFFSLGKTASHRRVNHDPVSATITALMENPRNGAVLANLHLILDVIGEEIKKQHGVPVRDLWEAQMNYIVDKLIRKRKNGF
jgi:hypothetical protein